MLGDNVVCFLSLSLFLCARVCVCVYFSTSATKAFAIGGTSANPCGFSQFLTSTTDNACTLAQKSARQLVFSNSVATFGVWDVNGQAGGSTTTPWIASEYQPVPRLFSISIYFILFYLFFARKHIILKSQPSEAINRFFF
jgi:hypothetical protein